MPNLADLIDPMPGKIAVLVETKDEITPAGLYIPEDSARTIHESRATQGTVVAIGEEDPDDLESPPSRLKVGDVVIFGKYAGTKVTYKPNRETKQAVIIMGERDILAIVRLPAEAAHLKVKT